MLLESTLLASSNLRLKDFLIPGAELDSWTVRAVFQWWDQRQKREGMLPQGSDVAKSFRVLILALLP